MTPFLYVERVIFKTSEFLCLLWKKNMLKYAQNAEAQIGLWCLPTALKLDSIPVFGETMVKDIVDAETADLLEYFQKFVNPK